MVRNLTVGAILVALTGFVLLIFGAPTYFWPSLYDVSPALSGSGPKVLAVFDAANQEIGIFQIAFGIVWLSVSLIPFRRGERWAWYTIAIAGIGLYGADFGQELMALGRSDEFAPYAGVPSNFYFEVPLLILWVIGILLPLKQVFKR